MDYKKIKETIKQHSEKIAQLQIKQKKMIKEFYILADKTKAKDILKKIQK